VEKTLADLGVIIHRFLAAHTAVAAIAARNLIFAVSYA
jgi:hypothetical protein